MAKPPERARRLPMPPPPGPLTVARRSADRDGTSAHHALWWVVCYEGARDYAQAVQDAPGPAWHDAPRFVRAVDAVHPRTPA